LRAKLLWPSSIHPYDFLMPGRYDASECVERTLEMWLPGTAAASQVLVIALVALALSMAGAMIRDDEKKFGAPAVYPE
jgi:hypothetical protein